MTRIYYGLADLTACGYYRSILPCRFLRTPLATLGIDLRMRTDFEGGEADDFDVFVFHRHPKPSFWPKVLDLKAKGKKIIWELDDDVFNIPPWNPVKFSRAEQWYMRQALEIADAVIVSTQWLSHAVWIASTNQRVFVCPNLLDLDAFPDAKYGSPDKMEDDWAPVRILWAGGPTHEGDQELLIEPIGQLLEQYGERIQFTFFGYIHPEIQARYWCKGVDFIPGVPLQDYVKVLRNLRPHIGLCPLQDIPFNRSKSVIKWMEMTAAGAAVVASPVGQFADEQLGLISPDNLWANAIAGLIESAADREAVHSRSMGQLREGYCWQSGAAQTWIDALQEICR